MSDGLNCRNRCMVTICWTILSFASRIWSAESPGGVGTRTPGVDPGVGHAVGPDEIDRHQVSHTVLVLVEHDPVDLAVLLAVDAQYSMRPFSLRSPKMSCTVFPR